MVRQLPETREWKKQIAGRTYGLSRRFALWLCDNLSAGRFYVASFLLARASFFFRY